MFLHPDSEVSDQTGRMDAQADLSFSWAQRSFCWFCHEAAQMMFISIPHSFIEKGTKVMAIPDIEQDLP